MRLPETLCKISKLFRKTQIKIASDFTHRYFRWSEFSSYELMLSHTLFRTLGTRTRQIMPMSGEKDKACRLIVELQASVGVRRLERPTSTSRT